MILADLLAHANEFLDNNTALIEGDADALFTDELIVRHLNQAQKILCRRAWVIIDTGHAQAGRITLATGKATYDLHKSVLRVFDAVPDSQSYPTGRATDAQIKNASNTNEFDAFEVGEAASRAGIADTGTMLSFATDAGTRVLRAYRTPTSTENGTIVTLKVARLPVTYLTLDATDAEPEVPEEYHLSLVDYAAGRCLLQPNVDSQSKADGRELLAMFDEVVRQARQERMRAEMGTGRWAFASTTAVIDR